MEVSWPVTCATYVLERTFSLNAPIDWNPVSGSVVVEGNLYVYKTAFENARMGRASAVAVLLFFVLLMVTMLQLRLFRSDDR